MANCPPFEQIQYTIGLSQVCEGGAGQSFFIGMLQINSCILISGQHYFFFLNAQTRKYLVVALDENSVL